MDKNLIWMIIGFVGQGFFSARFILQWVMSEIKKQSIIPLGFWYFSLLGGATLFAYATVSYTHLTLPTNREV